MKQISFPEGFLFGAAISDYQHFGGSRCDLPDIPAAKHSEYFEHDFGILSELGLNAFRTGIEWARIEPKEGKIDQSSVAFYHDYFSRLRQTGLATIVTLHHFTNPKWIHNHGGWLSGRVVTKFLEYVEFVCQEFGGYVDYFVTVNEPAIYTQLAYLSGDSGLPPYRRSSGKARQCLRNLDEVIRGSYEIIHGESQAKVGIANDFNMLPLALQEREGVFRWFSQKIGIGTPYSTQIENWKGFFDFCGINYYCRTSLGRSSAYPEGLRQLSRYVFRKYGKPVIITENGLPNRDDAQKTAYLLLHLKQLADAIALDGTEIAGYCWWSFLHGYEWGLGYKPFFALVDVDVNGAYKRTLTQTACAYGDVARRRGVSREVYQRFYPLRSSLEFDNWR